MSDRPAYAAVINCGLGNLFSVQKACENAGIETAVTSDSSVIAGAAGLILPGVGAFSDAMDNLARLDLIGPVKDFILSGRPFLAICLGMQLLMTESEEFGVHKGLDIIKGPVRRFDNSGREPSRSKVPQVGWNRIFYDDGMKKDRPGSPLDDVQNGEFMYFVHSYYCAPERKDVFLTTTRYAGIEYCSGILWKNVTAFQFHPEKSGKEGLKIYRNWALALDR